MEQRTKDRADPGSRGSGGGSRRLHLWSSRLPHAPAVSGAKSANPAAYDAYMRGKVIVSSENPEDNEAAIKLFEQAVAADPNFAAAYAELARAYSIKARYFAPVRREEKVE